MSHYKEVCEFGAVHGQCRCVDRNKAVRPIKCNMPERHQPTPDEPIGDEVFQRAVQAVNNRTCLYRRELSGTFVLRDGTTTQHFVDVGCERYDLPHPDCAARAVLDSLS